MTSLRALVAPLSPRRRRWHRFLAALPLDVDALPRPVAEPGPRDFIICGCPRTGTSLLSAALFQPPAAVTVMEPWDGMRLPPAELFASLRAEIAMTGRLGRGRLDIDRLQEHGAVRWCQEGEARPVVGPDVDLLGVKWTGYWRYLGLLPTTKFLVCLRHPIGVVASSRHAGGRVGDGLQYETAFNRQLNRVLEARTPDPALRRVLLYDYVHERVLPYLQAPNVLAVRYERWFDDTDGLLAEIGAFLGADLGHLPTRVRPPASPALPATDLDLVRRRCRTAAALGYGLEPGADVL